MARILIVDDSPTELHILSSILTKHGHQVNTAGSGEEGVERAKADKPDLILMDIVMPGMNGFQATRKISNDPETNDIPIIVVTTKDQDTDRMWSLRQGAKEFLVKPVDEADLMNKVGTLLAG